MIIVAEALRVAATACARAADEAAAAESWITALANRADVGEELPCATVARRLREVADRLAESVGTLHDTAREIVTATTPTEPDGNGNGG